MGVLGLIRGLTGPEVEILRPVFVESLPYEKIRLTIDGPFSAGSTKVIGNTIHFLAWQLVPAILVHEAVHIWQWRHSGWYYALQSLRDQAAARWRVGTRNGAYAWQPAARAGVPWGGLRSEPQAALIEDAYVAGLPARRDARLIAGGEDFTAYGRAALEELAAGRGAPRGG